MKSIRFGGLMTVITVSLLALSCQKNDHPITPSLQSSMQTLLMNATNDVTQSAALESSDVEDILGSGDSSSCPAVTFDTSKTVYPHVKTVDYGSGCMGSDSLDRKGQKIITYYANPDTASIGTLITEVAFNNFSVNDIAVTGTVKSYIDSSSTAANKIIKVVTSKTLNGPNGDTKTFTATTYWKQIQGKNTMTRKDDVFQITGNAWGTETLDGATQLQWASTIASTDPVIKPADCNHRVKGTVNVAIHITTGGDSNFTETLDYGNGDCDNKATLSINGGTPQPVTLPLYFWPLSL
jgi:hypothetical protein